ncbi:MAG: hypothetical protein IT373_23740, partial [Polyangiaceae bacterium]|nr:hypothetical protein [Polyangiaceae bacterium]
MKSSSLLAARAVRRACLVSATAVAVAALAVGACHARDSKWDAAPTRPTQAIGLAGGVALVDAPTERVLLLPVVGELELAPVSVPIGPGFAAAAPTPDGEQLLVLTRGTVPRRSADDPRPALSVLAGRGAEPGLVARYELTDPLSGLAVDPLSEYAVVYASPTDTSFVQNPNELVVIELGAAVSGVNPFAKTLRSFGSAATALTFTEPLGLPGGTRRLLVVETERDLHLVDFSHLELPEITVRLASGADTRKPAGVAVTDGDPASDEDARLAVRLAGDPNVILIDLLPVPESEAAETPQSYRVLPNEVYVGGVPSALAFVATDGGLRLAALLPAQGMLTLVDPATGIAAEVELGASFDHMSLVTSIV